MFNKSAGVIVGDSAVFQLLVSVPVGRANFNVKLTGVDGNSNKKKIPTKYSFFTLTVSRN